MNILGIMILSIGVAMDAFAVSVCKGLSMKKMEWKKALIVGWYFGLFQMLMPIIGYILAENFDEILRSIDHWIAFILLSFIGIKMIKESYEEKQELNENVDFKTMFGLAIATSIDALAVGITYAFLEVTNIIEAFLMIGLITFILSTIGVKIGNKFGRKYKNNAELIGGFILVCIGTKILIEHLFL